MTDSQDTYPTAKPFVNPDHPRQQSSQPMTTTTRMLPALNGFSRHSLLLSHLLEGYEANPLQPRTDSMFRRNLRISRVCGFGQ